MLTAVPPPPTYAFMVCTGTTLFLLNIVWAKYVTFEYYTWWCIQLPLRFKGPHTFCSTVSFMYYMTIRHTDKQWTVVWWQYHGCLPHLPERVLITPINVMDDEQITVAGAPKQYVTLPSESCACRRQECM